MIFAHAFIGLIVAWFINLIFVKEKNKNLLKSKKLLVWWAAVIGSIFPDFDILYVFLVDINIPHRELLTHSIVPYLILYLLGFIIVKLLNANKFYLVVLSAFIFGVISHLFADIFIGAVYLFNPISKIVYNWQPFSTVPGEGILPYIMSKYMLVEWAFIFLGSFLLIKDLYKDKREFNFVLLLLVTIQLGVWLALFPFLTK